MKREEEKLRKELGIQIQDPGEGTSEETKNEPDSK